ncbi:MAG: cytochrome c biogenesis CcdA family protein [bacterium]|nr:cytochrome c biogenesis CcdA family protein [bacterium]
MDILINTSLITAFLAGMAALFAPCCITVLLPSYLASIFKQRRKVLFMTFVFFLGIFLVFLPLGLGFGWFGRLIIELHSWIYFFGGIFMILLGLSIFLGFHPRLPFHVSPKLDNQGIGSIFLLGIFSGLATTCCAPVLAGVIALSVLPGSIFWGGMYSLVYVLGMVLPLFIISLFFDKINFTERFSVLQKPVRYKILGREIVANLSQSLAGIMFFLIGALILFLTLTDRLRMESDMLLRVNILTAKYLYNLKEIIGSIPWFVFPVLFIALIFIIIKTSLKQIK